jgi:membrane protease YdiL (CAAX protease family)
MQYPPLFLLTFSLIISGIVSAWRQPDLGRTAAPSALAMSLLGLAVAVGTLAGYVTLIGACVLAVFVAVAVMATRPDARPATKVILTTVTALLALLLAAHLLPGFNNLRVLDNVKLSVDAKPYTLYANFDKAAVGLVLLAFFCKRSASWAEFGRVLKKALPLIALTIGSVIGAALLLGVVRPDVKIPDSIFAFIIINLFFTCIAEEAFFRGLLQEKLSATLSTKQHGEKVAIACSALLFGAVHFAGGLAYMALATIAGLGYACIYSATKRIEAPIVTHFFFNLFHFIGFTYPALA